MDWQMWLDDLTNKPLPGGVAAAATAAAMGAALVAKAARVTMRRQALDQAGQDRLLAIAGSARTVRDELALLARADEQAFRGVLKASSETEAVRDQKWQAATAEPVRLAEACHSLLMRRTPLAEACWPAVQADLEIGRRLLETGMEAGLLAAESNLRAWGDRPLSQPLRDKVNALREETT